MYPAACSSSQLPTDPPFTLAGMTSSYSGATPPRAFSSTTPLSAAHKPFFNPDFSLEKQRHRPVKVVSLPVLHFEQQRSHPDEEKGRSFRSGRGSRSSSNTSLCFGDLSIDSSATAVEGELDDGELADVWLEQKQKEAGVGGQDPFAVPSVLGDIFQEERRLDLRLETRRGVDWTGVLAEKIETASGELDLR